MRHVLAAFTTALAALALIATPALAAETTTTTTSSATSTAATTTTSTETGYSQTPELKEEGSGYNEKPEVPKEKHKNIPEEEEVNKGKKGVEHNKERHEPKIEEKEEVVITTTPTTTTELPFTGYDLRWAIGIGLLLIVAGVLSLLAIRRREHRGHR